MYRPVNCKRYWKWKRQQAKRAKEGKRKSKKRKPKTSITDCIDENEKAEATEPILKVKRPKTKKKKKKTSLLGRQLIKRVPYADLLMRCIKPSMEIREYMLNPRHTACLKLTSMDVVPEIVETAISLLSQTQVTNKFSGRKKCGSIAKRKTKDDEKTERAQSKKKSSRKEAESRKIEELDSDEDSECRSICSFDSQICLAGTKLTSKDQEIIKKFRTQSQEEGD